jgi:putative transcriptional regulator
MAIVAKRYVRIKATPETIAEALRKTDWAKVDATTDEDIARQVAEDPDTAPILSDAEHVASQVRMVRLRLDLTQAAFARRFHVPLGTIRDWEQGRRTPDAPARALLKIIDREPEAAARALTGRKHAA